MQNTQNADLMAHYATVSVTQLKAFLELSINLMGKRNGEWPLVYVRAEGEHKLLWVCGKSTKTLQFVMDVPEVLQNFPRVAFKAGPLLGVVNCFKGMTTFSMLYGSFMAAVSLYTVDELEIAGMKWPKMLKVPTQNKAWDLPRGFGRYITNLLDVQGRCKDKTCSLRNTCSSISISRLGFAAVSCDGPALAPFTMDEHLEEIVIPRYTEFFRVIQNEEGRIHTWRREDKGYMSIEAGPWSFAAKIPAVEFPDLHRAWECVQLRQFFVSFSSADAERLRISIDPMYYPEQAGRFRMESVDFWRRIDIQVGGRQFGVSPQFNVWKNFVVETTVRKFHWLLAHGFNTIFFQPESARCGAWNGTVMLFTDLK